MLDSYDLATIVARIASDSIPDDQNTTDREAAVAVVLREHAGEAEVLLMKRADREGDPWSGHMAFPGGRRDPRDGTLLDTAIRETREEVGIDLARDGRVLARLPDVPAMARGKRVGMTIAAFVFALERAVTPVPNHEVAEVLWARLGPLARGEAASTYPYVWEGRALQLPALVVEERVVWGLTHQMLQLFFEALHR